MRNRSFRIEPLETRVVFDGDAAWASGAALTLSFAPDGTMIGSHENTLEQTLQSLGTAQWQDAVVRAFQTWAQYVNVNIGVVGDSGVPFGTPTDSTLRRFGDIRIGATPMSAETLAVSVPHDESTGGSWSGDVLFNSLGEFPDIDTLYKVALHEAGHVLGLEHNPDPLSPMYLHGPDIEPVPVASDIDKLMALYGARGPDRNELNKANDDIGYATRMGLSDDDANYDGATPAISFGEISTASDVDFFELPSIPGYSGPLRFQLQTLGLSLLQAQLTIVDGDGNILGHAAGQGHAGDAVAVTIPSATLGKYYARVEANTTDAFGVGGYALVGSFVDRQTATDAEIARAVDQAFRLIGYDESSIDDLDIRGFLDHNHFDSLDDDAHSDDDDAGSTELKAVVESSLLRRYRAVATLTDPGDRDVYRAYSAESESASQFLTVAVESLSPGGLIPRAVVRDRHGNVLNARVIANGAGLYVIQVAGIQSDRQYFVEVASASADPQFATGNYKLAITFDAAATARDAIFAGTLTAAAPTGAHSLYVAKTQLFSLLFSTSAAAPGGNAWMAIYNTSETPLFYLAAPIGEARSASSLLLDPGEYRVEFGMVDAAADSVAFALTGSTISQPIGPPVLNTTTTPIYSCSGTPGSYCYPGSVVSTTPVYVSTLSTKLALSVTRPAVAAPADNWYWSSNQLATNPLQPHDTNGDGAVTALDALLIINELNASGPRAVTRPPVPVGFYLDVNSDGVISPLDALLIINRLNAHDLGAGEAAVAAPAIVPAGAAADYAYWMLFGDSPTQRRK